MRFQIYVWTTLATQWQRTWLCRDPVLRLLEKMELKGTGVVYFAEISRPRPSSLQQGCYWPLLGSFSVRNVVYHSPFSCLEIQICFKFPSDLSGQSPFSKELQGILLVQGKHQILVCQQSPLRLTQPWFKQAEGRLVLAAECGISQILLAVQVC